MATFEVHNSAVADLDKSAEASHISKQYGHSFMINP
ncbi:hypothetical protein FOXG_22447 [Fusarium oxysporum f. sp. lycopersici 4287]|uniref:Uncharacterized protein n=1 Tax=Fusarium oxysporum f. sp. lycopersici (strain 4287 / CBS 123668 / FGSC 9935 / NRRL 34936) TaxID=426428 RepID=A0A0J9V0C1_FUSO4|nr:hypothetical protein FOXG_19261 [Fusarium oxysporum f. sp. lycopersici 4287]XP_018242817.1 hypothetical protein FOXG_19398 [Fusarium oxysporum f. sp. lycopersici 4287]XP_018257037.1 uncharacterized protein FOXG_22447 [Fusarium oxysporum f. sp. lycopersici 4287]KNB04301.1 hypothetical protein FOXG_19261 [Fusarium oxysporum f. sp. lycopersici 4287]KNB04772.1 hypothetical protein FOXG_19398 [Fusarium oxysporum f. sp. lycopersici 4287]KNB18992.1 hypothetical protein FOXG_22447 [Fusarium oxyspor